MEREVMLTGVGGQGVQLAAQVLARAAVHDGRTALMLGLYLGSMRGGNSDSTVVIGDPPLRTPPIVSRTWAALALHAQYWPALAAKLRPGAVVVVNQGVFNAALDHEAHHVVGVDAVGLATTAGSPQAASLVLCGALSAATGLITPDALVAAMHESLPPYRRQHALVNEAAIRAGAAAVPHLIAPAWEEVPA